MKLKEIQMMNRKLLYFLMGASLLSELDLARAAYTPVDLTGWTEDVVINDPTPYNLSVTATMEGGYRTFSGFTWVEEGVYTRDDGDDFFFEGLVAGSHTSIGPSGAEFVFQDFSGNNSLFLGGLIQETLTLASSASYSSLVFIGSTTEAYDAEVTVTLNFSDLTSTKFVSREGIARDWFDSSSPESAYLVGGRASTRYQEGFTRLYRSLNDAIRLHEYVIDLDPADQSKQLVSIDVMNSGPGGRIALFAVSGEAIPEPGVALLSCAALLGFGLRRRRI